jgi:guanylate kinase
MLEYASYEGRAGQITYYGTPREPVEKHLQAGDNVVLEIEVQGAKQIKEIMPESVLIFILPPSMTELEKRLTGRGTETALDIEKRLRTAEKELSEADLFDFKIVNDSLAECVENIRKIIEQPAHT